MRQGHVTFIHGYDTAGPGFRNWTDVRLGRFYCRLRNNSDHGDTGSEQGLSTLTAGYQAVY